MPSARLLLSEDLIKMVRSRCAARNIALTVSRRHVAVGARLRRSAAFTGVGAVAEHDCWTQRVHPTDPAVAAASRASQPLDHAHSTRDRPILRPNNNIG